MKITSIKQQVKNTDRYSIFVEGKYVFSLSEGALIESKIHSGQELTAQQVSEFKKLSADDKLYNRALRYAAMRPRSRWEVTFYLERKQASPALIDNILNRLSNIGLIDDLAFAKTFITNRQLLRPSSRRKIFLELKQKRVDDKTIEEALAESTRDENA